MGLFMGNIFKKITNWKDFERLCADILSAEDYEIESEPSVDRDGTDIVAIEEYMKDKHPRLGKIESLRQALIRFLSQDYSVETTPIARYSEIWKRFLEKFEVDKYIQEAKWQCTEISNYYIENQSFKTSRGVAILSWIIAPISIVMAILQLNSEKLKPIVIGNWYIDPTFFWLGVTLFFSFIGYISFPRLWNFFYYLWKNRKDRKKG